MDNIILKHLKEDITLKGKTNHGKNIEDAWKEFEAFIAVHPQKALM